MTSKSNGLLEITRKESGILIYESADSGVAAEMIICNWSSIEGLPRMDPLGYMSLGLGEEIEAIQSNELADIGGWLESNYSPERIEIIYDLNGDSESLKGSPGTLYEVRTANDEKAYVIAPHDWN